MDEQARREQERMDKYINRSNAKAKVSPGYVPPVQQATGMWHVNLVHLPCGPKAPVTLAINGQNVFDSGSKFPKAEGTLTHPIDKSRASNSFVLDVKVMRVSYPKTFEWKDGEFLKFEGSSEGIKITQQRKPF